jgi:uroporphyrinogen decarboxylase
MTSKERITLALRHKESDRVAVHDSPWFTTIRRWRKEGLPEWTEPQDYFNYELESVGADMSFQLPTKTVEETVEYTITQGGYGETRKNWKNQTSTPECIDFLIKDRKMWEQYKPGLKMSKTRFDWLSAKGVHVRARDKGRFFTFNCGAGYDMIQVMIGSERLLIAIAEDPEWVRDIMKTLTDLIIAVSEEMMSVFKFDGVFFYDDMGYRNASLFSPKAYKEIFFPYHKKAWGFFNGKGLPVILHSCGCVKGLIPMFIEAGLTCLQPLEVKAGMDLVELKKDYGGKLAFWGGIDVRKMSNPDPKVIEEEIKTKVTFAKKGGGYIYHSDHSVPDDISFSQYCRVIDLVHKYGSY